MRRYPLFVLLIILTLVWLAGGKAQAQGGQPDAGASDTAQEVSSAPDAALGIAFTYQGQLKSGGTPYNGACDFQFKLYDASSAGAQIGATQTASSVSVSSGVFTTQIDFGANAFDDNARWLDISARCPAGGGSYTALTPRQALTPAPYAFALPGFYTQQNGMSPNLIGGHGNNSVTSGVHGATISGGGSSDYPHSVTDDYGTIGGGWYNQAGDNAGTDYDSSSATVSGGQGNKASGHGSTIGGGLYNTTSDAYVTIGGGDHNTASGLVSTIGGGDHNTASGLVATIGGGDLNTASGDYATTGGGDHNTASGSYAKIGGGQYNWASNDYVTIGGGGHNTASGSHATIGGGSYNTASDDYVTIGGGYQNAASGWRATIGGGLVNTASGGHATIGGGWANTASGYEATIGGGFNNIASGGHSTVSGGTRAAASHFGEMAYASGAFAEPGDAQASLYVLRRETSDATLTELFLDGVNDRITLAADRVMTFDILVVASHRFGGGSSAGYQIAGVIRNIGGATAFVGTPVKTVLGENVTGWDVQVEASNALDALVVKVQGSADTSIRWVASVRTVEVGR